LVQVYRWMEDTICQNVWDKSEVLWRDVGEHIENLGNVLGTHWELEGNLVGTHWEPRKNEKKSSPIMTGCLQLFSYQILCCNELEWEWTENLSSKKQAKWLARGRTSKYAWVRLLASSWRRRPISRPQTLGKQKCQLFGTKRENQNALRRNEHGSQQFTKSLLKPKAVTSESFVKALCQNEHESQQFTNTWLTLFVEKNPSPSSSLAGPN